jgi:SH3 domain protein
MKIKILLLLTSLLLVPAAYAQTKYVTDDFEVMLRTGPSIKNKIIRALRSGTRIEVLRIDSGNGHSQVQTSSGQIGYLVTRFLSEKPSARNRVNRLESQLAKLRSEPDQVRTLLAESLEQNQSLIEQNSRGILMD